MKNLHDRAEGLRKTDYQPDNLEGDPKPIASDSCKHKQTNNDVSEVWCSFKGNRLKNAPKVESMRVFCCGCGHRGHFVNDCPKSSLEGPVNSVTFSAEYANNFLKAPLKPPPPPRHSPTRGPPVTERRHSGLTLVPTNKQVARDKRRSTGAAAGAYERHMQEYRHQWPKPPMNAPGSRPEVLARKPIETHRVAESSGVTRGARYRPYQSKNSGDYPHVVAYPYPRPLYQPEPLQRLPIHCIHYQYPSYQMPLPPPPLPPPPSVFYPPTRPYPPQW